MTRKELWEGALREVEENLGVMAQVVALLETLHGPHAPSLRRTGRYSRAHLGSWTAVSVQGDDLLDRAEKYIAILQRTRADCEEKIASFETGSEAAGA
jgi:hypothetical protein